MVEADSHLKWLPASILDMCKVFEHIDMLSIGISSLTQLIPPYMAQILGFWVTCGVKRCHYVMVEADSHLKLLPASILDIFKVFEHIDMLSIDIQYQPYTVIPTLLSSVLGL
jgi:hypothetical protein